jgi:hypothetical protein
MPPTQENNIQTPRTSDNGQGHIDERHNQDNKTITAVYMIQRRYTSATATKTEGGGGRKIFGIFKEKIPERTLVAQDQPVVSSGSRPSPTARATVTHFRWLRRMEQISWIYTHSLLSTFCSTIRFYAHSSSSMIYLFT